MTRTIVLFFLYLILTSCGIAKQRTEIRDFLILPNGKNFLGNKNLNAFVFENSLKNIPFQQFITSKFKTNNFYQKELPVTIDKQQFTLLFYDIDEFERYFGTPNFTALIQENDAEKYGNQTKFIALSIINDRHEDCLSENSLYLNVLTTYLKNLKDEYLNQQ